MSEFESYRNGQQIKLLLILNDLNLRGKLDELKYGLKYMNKILTRFYLSSYWKFVFRIISREFPKSVDSIPQFIDCLHAMNIPNKNEVIYSIVYLLFSQNYFKQGVNLLQMYHLSSSTLGSNKEKEINTYISILNANLEYVKWQESVSILGENNEINDYDKQIAEKCCFQLELLIDSLDIPDFEIKKITEIYAHYDKIDEIEQILETYANKQPEYLNAQKYLFEFKVNYKRNLSLPLFQRIVKICPSDGIILKYYKQLRDVTTSIDVLFDLLDYYQWKYNKECWSNLNKLLLKCEKNRRGKGVHCRQLAAKRELLGCISF